MCVKQTIKNKYRNKENERRNLFIVFFFPQFSLKDKIGFDVFVSFPMDIFLWFFFAFAFALLWFAFPRNRDIQVVFFHCFSFFFSFSSV